MTPFSILFSKSYIDHSSSSQKSPSFTDDYIMGNEIGKGYFATVRIARRKNSNDEIYAVKVIPKIKLSSQEKKVVKNEAKILQSLHHPNILELVSFYKEKKKFFLVTKYMRGGTLFDRILAKTRYSEEESLQVSRTVLDAIRYCHDRNIVHRDLKPENLLLESMENNVLIKIADFGFAKIVPSTGLRTGCGSAMYIAPDILARKPYGKEVDMWSIGVIIFILLSGQFPFADSDEKIRNQKICTATYDFSGEEWDTVSVDAKDIISKLLVVDAPQRITSEQGLQHSWFKSEGKIKTYHESKRSKTEAMKKSLSLMTASTALSSYSS